MSIESDTEQIRDHAKRGNYHAAINIAISGLNECRRNEDQTGVDYFLDIILSITTQLAQEFGSKSYLEKVNTTN